MSDSHGIKQEAYQFHPVKALQPAAERLGLKKKQKTKTKPFKCLCHLKILI